MGLGDLDDVVSAAVEVVALAADGMPLAALWGSLEDAAADAGVDLAAPAVRSALWLLLAAEPGVRAALANGHAVSGGPAGGPPLGSAAAAEAAGVVLSAARDLQDAALGLHDSHLTRFSVSEMQRKCLSMVGAAGRRGALQSDLATALDVENRNFYYVVKVLEQRGLLVKHSVTVKRPTAPSQFANHVTTNILHLPRFKPPGIGRKASLTDGRSTAHGGAMRAGLLPGGGVAPLAEDEVAVLDDTAHFRRICAQLERCAGRQANESELKVVLGYRGTRGHRLWRRVKPLLAKRGHVEEFLARSAEDKAVKCIKLVKPWKEGEEGSSSEEESEDEGVADGGPMGRQVAELTLDRQILRELVAAGADGLVAQDVGPSLQLNMKRNESRLKELETRFGATRHTVNKGRMITMRYTAPQALLDHFAHSVAPGRPAGGWLAAVAAAIEAGLDEGEEFPWPEGAGGKARRAPLPLPQQVQQQVQQQQVEEDAAAGGDDAAAAAVAAAPGVPMPANALGLPLPPPRQELAATVTNNFIAEGVGGVALLVRPGPEEGQHRRVFTLNAQRRLDWVLERIAAQGFMLASEMPRFLADHEEAETGRTATRPDRKTCDRLVDRGQQQGLLQVLSINFPAQWGGLSNRTHSVLAPPGTQPDEAFVQQVYDNYQAFKRRVHSGPANVSMRVRHAEEVLGKVLPVVDLQPLLPANFRHYKRAPRPGEADADGGEVVEVGGGGADAALQLAAPTRGPTLQYMQVNGYNMLRMQRLRIIHTLACQLAGLLPAPPHLAPRLAQRAGSSEVAGLADGPSGGVFMVTMVPAAELGSSARVDMQRVDLDTDATAARRVVSARSLWASLTVQQFLEALGSSNPDAARVSELAASGRTLGEVSAEEVETVLCCGQEEMGRVQSRLAQALDLAYRMGLLSSVLPLRATGPQSQLGSAASCYAVRAELFVQEPVSAAPPPPQQQQQGGAAAAAAPAQPGRPAMRTFDMAADPAAHDGYWSLLHYWVCRQGNASGRVSLEHTLGRCFPYNSATEAQVERAWSHRKSVTQEQMEAIHDYLGEEDARDLGFERTRQVADALHMPYESVLAFVAEHVRPSLRLGRLAVGRLGAIGVDLSDDLNVVVRRRDQQRRYYARKRMARLEQQYPGGVPDVLLEPRMYSSGRGARKPATAVSVGRKRKGQREAAEALRPAAGDDSDDDLPVEEPEVDLNALLPRPEPAPLRKKRWYRDEDRQLLTAWAGFLAVNGRDRVLLWRAAPGRPANLKHQTLKRRLSQLQKDGQLGQMVQQIENRALRLHALLLKRDRDVAAAAGDQQQQHQQAAPGQEEEQQPAGDGRSGGEAAPPTAGGKRKAPALVQPASWQAKRARVAEAEAASARAQVAAAGAGPDAGVAACRGLIEALLPAVLRRELRKGRLPEAAAALDDLAALVEKVVASAPKQHKEQPGGAAAAAGADGAAGKRRTGPKPLTALQQHHLRTAGVQVAARPQALLKRWAQALRGGGGARAAAGAAAAAAPGAAAALALEQPSPAVTAALALAQSLLFMGADSGVLGVGYETALSGRFSPNDIWRAFELLQRQGALVPSAALARQDFQLTDRWRANLQPAGFLPDHFREAAAAARQLADLRRLDISAGAAPDDDGGEIEEDDVLMTGRRGGRGEGHSARAGRLGRDLPGGAVAELLGGMAAGRLVLRPHGVTVTPLLTAAEGAAVSGGGLEEHTAALAAEMPVRASLASSGGGALAPGGSEGSAAGGASAAGTAAAAAAEGQQQGEAEQEEEEEGMAEASGEAPAAGDAQGQGDGAAGGLAGAARRIKFTRQEVVLYQPALVAVCLETRAAAEAAARMAATACGVGGAAFDEALRALRSAGAAGASRSQLSAALAAAGGSAGAAGRLLEQLLLHGLARAICGFEGRRYAAAEASTSLLAFPHMPQPAPPAQPAVAGGEAGAAQPPADQQQQLQQQQEARVSEWRAAFAHETRALCAALRLPPGGQLQPSLDVPLRPWVDHHGRLNAALWEALVNKVLAAAARAPGLPEEVMAEELSVLAPQHARELLRILVAARVLRLRKAAAAQLPPRRGAGALAACFGGAAPAGSGGGAAGAAAGGGMGSDDDAEEEEGRPRQQRFYFVQPGATFGGTSSTLPPAALLPLPAAGGDGVY